MKLTDFWKNFKLAEELDISGRFIYNGLRFFHEMDSLYHEEEIFEVLYNLSVGLERLLKICVVLIEHDDAVDQEAFERTLITHTHQELLRRVKVKHKLQLEARQNEFLDLLGSFYKTDRYGRYGIGKLQAAGNEKLALHLFITKYLGVTIRDTPPVDVTPNDTKIRTFIGKLVGQIATPLYEVVRKEAGRLNLYTYELRSDSKAAKIFLRKELDFSKEDLLWKELIVFLVNSDDQTGQLKLLKEIVPLDFDAASTCDYLQCLDSQVKKLDVLDDLDALYDELKSKERKQRLEVIGLVGNPMVYFDDDIKDDEEEGVQYDESD